MSAVSTADRSPSERILGSVERFVGWLERTGYASYDPYDMWGTRYGLWSRRLYYSHSRLGLPWIAPIVLMETLCPSLRVLFVGRQRFATADGQLILAFLNLHALELQPFACHIQCANGWLPRARALGEELLNYSIAGYSGYCWGYPFDWQNNRGLWKRSTPYITCTPYCYEAFLALHHVTGEERYLGIAASIARFVGSDLRDTPAGAEAAAASYSPMDCTKVINASAYRAFVLLDAARRFASPAAPLGQGGHKSGEDSLPSGAAAPGTYFVKAWKNLNFILQCQRADGSWLYAEESPAEAFIDHFHTCFVLKNLVKCYRLLQEKAVWDSIRKGWEYYRQTLFHSDGNPKSFAVEPRTQLARLEMYNFAEAITLGTLLKGEIPEAFALAQELAARLVREHQLPDGHFVTRVFRGGARHTFPFLRWPQAQLFYALTNLLRATTGTERAEPVRVSETPGRACAADVGAR